MLLADGERWHAAQQAADNGNLAEMRSAYARFLLQMKQASPALRKARAEAFLRLGDSYRLEADQAEDPSAAPPKTPHGPDAATEAPAEPHGGKGHE